MAHLVFQTAFPGDLFLSIPLIRRIRHWDPKSTITLACRPGLGEFFLHQGLVEQVIEIDKRTRGGRAQARRQLRSEVWDAAFVPHQSVRTALWMFGVRTRRGKVAFSKWWNFCVYGHRLQRHADWPDALRQLFLATAFDAELAELFAQGAAEPFVSDSRQTPLVDLRQPSIPPWASMTLRPGAQKPSGRRIFLAPGSVWATKRWTLNGYAQLAKLLLSRGNSVEIVGSSAEKEICSALASRVKGVINHAGQTSLTQLVDLFSQGAALVCNDSGAMHAASVAGLPTVAIFGPTVLSFGFRPWQNQAVVVQKELTCRPCGPHGANKCPLGTHECMESLAVNQVISALESLIT